MAAPVWVLSVDLQTRTASFQTGLGDAARSARSAFADIRAGSQTMGKEVGTNMFEARHGVMLLGEEFGIRLPRALTAFITSIGPIGAAMEAAFPFLAIAVGATLLIQALAKVHEAGEKVTQDQISFGTAVNNAFNALDEKLLAAGIKADELRNDHLGALKKQLDLINRQSMDELVHSFSEVAKAADVVFGDFTSHWYTFGIGADGAKHALDQFKAQYASLLSQGKDKEAGDLLRGTRESAQHILDMQKQAAASEPQRSATGAIISGDQLKYETAMIALRKVNMGYSDDDLKIQHATLDALNAQLTIEGKITELKKLDGGNDKRSAAGAISAQNSAAARAAAESQLRMGMSAVAADKATAEAQLTIKRGSIADRLALDLEFAQREHDVQQAANDAEIAALDKLSKDYPNQLKALHEKSLELTQQHAAAVAEITAKSEVAAAALSLSTMEQSEREKIESTTKGSAARLAAINAAIKQEEALNLQDTNFYRELLNQRAEVAEQMLEESAKQAEAAGKEEAENEQKMGELKLAAWKTNQELQDSSRRITDQQRLSEAMTAENAEFALKSAALARELASLDKSGKDYQNKLKALQDQEKQMVQQHENEITAIKEKAEIERNQRILQAATQFNDTMARGLTQSIMGHQSWARMITSLGEQVVSGMLQNAIKSIMADDMTKERDAAAAARKAFNAGMQFPFPANIVMGPALGAMAFASVMAFSGGTDSVPGVSRGDSVPSLLTPGEGVVPGGIMDGLGKMARAGELGTGHKIYATAHFAPTVHAMDAEGVDRVLEKHQDTFQRHFERTVRRMNK